ncbi:Advillin [Cytospora mali]|uniref:Advillin n=1 Tax=Cytospora mali TaxID=578113 RepID=A0A194UVF4_CYTMA|nr:Advillin [Valsa mali var. pyri (nom. inval.)]
MSNEVSDFLRSVEQLNHRRDEDEEARSRELEEKLLQQRKERQARREERARSISPQKSSPANTPPPSSRRKDSTSQGTEDFALASSPIPALSAALQDQTSTVTSPPTEAMDLSSARPTSPIKETILDHEPRRTSIASSPSSAVSTKTPALSWQRRPPSQGPDRPRSRPLSIVAAENAAARSNITPAEAASPDHTPSRDQISEALGSKDPSWFRQTADRGANSAAYRKNQVEDIDTVDVSSARAQLPGMSQLTSTESEKEPPRERPASASSGTIASPLPLTDAQRLGPPADIQTDQEDSASGHSSPTRPASPTKGMGGFVQSAMMKRTDSVKRWSVTTPGLQRGGPGSNRNSFDSKAGATSPGPEPSPRPVSRSRAKSVSRPTSSHAKDFPSVDTTSIKDTAPEILKLEPADDRTPPTTPSRTMDPKRWSPTKGSWLDAALNKPESPKPKPAAPSNQPAWMVELNRAKAERAKNSSVDHNRTGSTVKKPEVKTGGLVRPAPLGTTVKPSSFGGLPSPSLTGERPLTPGLRGGFPKTSPALEKPSFSTEESARRGSVTSPTPPAPEQEKQEKPEKPEAPPATDFRAALRPRGRTIGREDKKEPAARAPSPALPEEKKEPVSRGSATSPALPVVEQEKPDTPTTKDFRAALRPRSTTIGKDTASKDENKEPTPRVPSPALSALPEQEKPEALPKKDFRAGLRPRGTTMSKEESKEPPPRVTSPALPSFPAPEQEKPETLAKKDFRAGLRSRGTTIGKDPFVKEENKEPANELANVFGKLRRAKTQNFVPPDELKDNILKGKSALNTTGGPKPYEKKDEFKDAILKKRADFQQAKEEGRNVTANTKVPQEQTIPEGLAKRAQMSRSGSISHFSHSRDNSIAKSPSEASAKAFESSRSSMLSAASPPTTSEDSVPAKEEKADSAPVSSLPKEKIVPGRLQNKVGGNALAERFNPALAGLLSRGPPGMGGPATKPFGTASGLGISNATKEPGPGPKLEHMTKGRARGPRRKAPTSVTKPAEPVGSEPAAAPASPLPESKEPVEKEAETEKPVPWSVPETKEPTKEVKAEDTLPPPVPERKGPITKQVEAEKPMPPPVSESKVPAAKVEAEEPLPPPVPERRGPIVKEVGTERPLPSPIAQRKEPLPEEIDIEKPLPAPIPESKQPVAEVVEAEKPPPSPIAERKEPLPTEAEPEKPLPSPVPESKQPLSEAVKAEMPLPSPLLERKEPIKIETEPEKPLPSPVPENKEPPRVIEAEKPLPSPIPKSKQPVTKEVEAQKPLPPPPAQEQVTEPIVPTKPIVKSPRVSPVEQFKAKMAQDQSRDSGATSPSISIATRTALVDPPRPKVTTSSSPNKIHEQVAAMAAKTQPAEDKKVDEQPPSPRKLDKRRMSKFFDEASLPTPKSEPEPERSASPIKKTFGVPTPPRKLPEPEKAISQPAISMGNVTTVFGRSVTPTKPQKPVEEVVPEPLNLRRRSTAKTPIARDLPALPTSSVQASPIASPSRSLSKSAGDVSAMLNGFFGKERPRRNYNVDAVEVLMNRSKSGSMVQTQKAQLFQVTEQGKKISVPSHYERVLFEREMYICSHTFTNEARKKVSEVYFWAGDEVAPSVIEDAQVFINKEARSMGGSLIRMRQGKETAEFIQALGGIVIIRRGSSNKYDSLAPNVLCGRRYMGQIVFDEVDFAPNTLCSGFPYLIAQQGKCYLWKGKGAGVDEVSCAKLVGMDLALMGELVEVEEGQEPDHFWSLFGGAKKMSSADHWRLKPSYDKYCGRLFCSDTADRRQIIEINPFSQADLSPTKIYILDAFFEMYIIIGREAQSQYASFHNALDFAQEYAILAAGMEDRPFVPVSTVVLEGIPRDLRSCFRKWRDDMSPTKMLPSSSNTAAASAGATGGKTTGLKRARSLRVLPLGQALQALGNAE